MKIKPRRVDFDASSTPATAVSEQRATTSRASTSFVSSLSANAVGGISAAEVAAFLRSSHINSNNSGGNSASSSFAAQLDALCARYALTPAMVAARLEVADALARYLQRYFAVPIAIRVFGSTTSGLGLVHSDLVGPLMVVRS